MSNSKEEQVDRIMVLYWDTVERMHKMGLYTPVIAASSIQYFTDKELTSFVAKLNTFLQARAEEKASTK